MLARWAVSGNGNFYDFYDFYDSYDFKGSDRGGRVGVRSAPVGSGIVDSE
jgi:hypothetical protein